MTIEKLVEVLFKDIPISMQTIDAKLKIKEALDIKYQEELKNHNEVEALGIVMTRYNNIDEAGGLARYSPEEIKLWKERDFIDIKTYKKKIFLLKACLYVGIYMCIGTVMHVFNTFIYSYPANMIFAAINGVLAGLGISKGMQIRKSIYETSISKDTQDFIIAKQDGYIKKSINTIVLLISFFMYILVVCVCLFNLKYPDSVQFAIFQMRIVGIVTFLLIKNILMLRFFDFYCREDVNLKYKHLKLIAVYTFLYYTAVLAIVHIIVGRAMVVLNVYYALVILAVVALLIYDLTLRKKLVYKNIVVNKRRIISIGLCVTLMFTYSFMNMGFWLLQPYISSLAVVEHNDNDINYDEKTGIYTITKSEDDFKILQITDVHLGGSIFSVSKDYKALEAVYYLIEYSQPDFVIVTGDLVFPMGIMSYSFNNETPITQFASFMRNVDVPWAFVYGNHDSEYMATSSGDELNDLFKSMSFKSSENLLYPYIQPDIMGRNNQIVKIENADGALNQVLFLLDSNDYINGGINEYDYIHDDQVDWYKANIEAFKDEHGEDVSSMLFFHIPLQEYRTANELYESGSNEVKYYFGEIGETMIDRICCSDYPSKLFDTAVKLGSTKAMFCGHDHYNNISLDYKGIRLTYGMSIDYLAMPGIEHDTKQRGGTLITLHNDSSYDVEQIKLIDIQ